MTKKELLENYTAEQLAEMVVELQNGKENKTFKVQSNKNYQKELDEFLKESPIHNSIDKICKDIIKQKNNAMAMEFTRIICDLLKRYGVYVHCTETKFGEKITVNSIEEQYGIVFDSMDFSQHDKEFTEKIEELKSEVEKYRKAFEDAKKERDCQVAEYKNRVEKDKEELERAKNTINNIDDILEKLFGVRHDTVDKPDEFEKILSDRAKGNLTDILPTEPIKVADMLINATHTREKGDMEKAFHKAFGNNSDTVEENVFDMSELRQIAEHLLVYCNHNGESEE